MMAKLALSPRGSNKTLTAIKQKSRFLTGYSSPAVVKRPCQLMCDMK